MGSGLTGLASVAIHKTS